MKKLVTIGGGSGQHQLLEGLRDVDCEISAIVSMADDGGSTGRLRADYNVLPPGDVRRCIKSLAQAQPEFKNLLEHRFDSGVLEGHTVGNIILASLQQSTGDFNKAVQVLSDILNVKGQVIPVSLDQATLCVKLENGNVIEGETNIDIPKHDANLKIETAFYVTDPKPNPVAISALKEADYIVLTIGDLYTSIIPNLIVPGIAEAIKDSSAKIIYSCNQTNKLGETNGFTAMEYVLALEKYLAGKKIDIIILNDTNNSNASESDIVTYDKKTLQEHGLEVITANIAKDMTSIDGIKLAKELANLCKQ